MFIFARCHRSWAAVTPAKYELDIIQVTIDFIIPKNWENNGTEKIGLVTPSLDASSIHHRVSLCCFDQHERELCLHERVTWLWKGQFNPLSDAPVSIKHLNMAFIVIADGLSLIGTKPSTGTLYCPIYTVWSLMISNMSSLIMRLYCQNDRHHPKKYLSTSVKCELYWIFIITSL